MNTCTVTAVSDKKSRNAIRRVRKLNPNAVVGVCGCYAQSGPDEIPQARRGRADRHGRSGGLCQAYDRRCADAAEMGLRGRRGRPAYL
ncbi:MAG: hypothetical protein ACLU3I_07765 [Acutalibacteraceae bacterium]